MNRWVAGGSEGITSWCNSQRWGVARALGELGSRRGDKQVGYPSIGAVAHPNQGSGLRLGVLLRPAGDRSLFL